MSINKNNKKKSNINPIQKKSEGSPFAYQEIIKNENQLYRVRTNATNLSVAITSAENPQLRNRYDLLRVYTNIDMDSTVTGLIRQRLLPLLSCEMMFINKNGEVNEDIKLYEEVWFRNFLELSHQSLFWGFSFIQLGDIINGKISEIELIPRQYCRPDFGIVSPLQQGNSGVSIFDDNIKDWVVPIYRDEHDLGDYMKLATQIMMKMYNEINWAEYCEKFGTPFSVVKTDLQNKQTRDNAASMLRNIGSSGWAVLNTTDDITMMSPSGGSSDFEGFLKYINEQLSIAILGQTLTSQSQTGGTEKLGNIHSQVLGEIIQSDIYFLESQITDKLIPRLKKLGILPDSVKEFKMKRKESVNPDKLLENVKKIKDMGYTVDAEWLSKKLNIPFTNGN